MIPRLVHRIWLDDPMPPEYVEYGRAWRRLHPTWAVVDWRDSWSLPPIRNRALFDDAETLCPRDWKRFRADLLRLELLWRFGGVYADCDVEPLAPFDPLLRHYAFAGWSPNRGPQGQRVVTQAVLGAEPAHPWIDACITGAPKAVEDRGDKPLAWMIGPWHVTRMLDGHRGEVTLLPERVFYPQSIRARDRGDPVDLTGSLATHKWANTRDNRKGGVG